MTERGLAAHMPYLPSNDFGLSDPGKRGLQAGSWAQYLLDDAAMATEALALLDHVQCRIITNDPP